MSNYFVDARGQSIIPNTTISLMAGDGGGMVHSTSEVNVV